MLYFFIWIFSGWENQVYKVDLMPFDLAEHESGASFINGVYQLETDGELIYIRDKGEPRIVVVDRTGKFVRVIGGRGGGPGEFKHSVTAFAIDGPALWAVGDRGHRAAYFEQGEPLVDFRLKGYNVDAIGPDARPFGFTNEYVLIQAHPVTRHLAAVYGYDGELKRFVGDIAPIDLAVLRKNPAFNDTFWKYDRARWYCLFKYRPVLQVYDQSFNQLADFELQGPEIEHRNEAFENFKKERPSQMPIYHFTDLKVFRGKVFAISPPALYQIDPETGETLSRTYFYGKGPNFARVAGMPLTMFHMAFLNDGTVVLGHPALPWEHDLWKVRLPFLE